MFCTEDTTHEIRYPETRVGYEGLGKVVPLDPSRNPKGAPQVPLRLYKFL